MSGRILFLSDYGYEDEFAGACRAVIARLEPEVQVVDLTHGIHAGDVRRGALALEAVAARAGTATYLAVVDPGVGTERRALALAAADGSHLVGPDNGLLPLAAERLGGVAAVADVSQGPLRLDSVTATFHGRDLFAPVAAHLAAGRPLAATGDPCEPDSLAALELPAPRRERGALVAHVLYVDRFGNLVLDARPDELSDPQATGSGGARVALSARSGEFQAVRGSTFADGERGLVVYDDSSGRLAVAVDRGSAAERLSLGRDDELRIEVTGSAA